MFPVRAQQTQGWDSQISAQAKPSWRGFSFVVLWIWFILLLFLEYSCFAVLCQFMLHKVNRLYIDTYPLFLWISFPSRSPQSRGENPLWSTVGSHESFILHVVPVLYAWQCQSPNPSHPHLGFCAFALFICVSISGILLMLKGACLPRRGTQNQTAAGQKRLHFSQGNRQ